jgi:hypothetical protein
MVDALAILQASTVMFMSEPSVCDITVPEGGKCTIVGDLHGQLVRERGDDATARVVTFFVIRRRRVFFRERRRPPATKREARRSAEARSRSRPTRSFVRARVIAHARCRVTDRRPSLVVITRLPARKRVILVYAG